MGASYKVSGVWKTLAGSYKTGGVWKSLQLFTKVTGVWKSINQLTASVDLTSASGSALTPGPAFTGNVTASGNGGTGSYTYAWEYVSGDTSVFCVNSSSATTHWGRASGVVGTFNSSWCCKVSDANGDAYTNNVTVTLTLS